jgi:hypothetical protein
MEVIDRIVANQDRNKNLEVLARRFALPRPTLSNAWQGRSGLRG